MGELFSKGANLPPSSSDEKTATLEKKSNWFSGASQKKCRLGGFYKSSAAGKNWFKKY